MKIHPEILEAVQISARFGFINREIFNEFVTKKSKRMSYYIWKQMTDFKIFESISCKLISKDYLKLSRTGKALALRMHLHPVSTPHIGVLSHDEFLMKLTLANESISLFKNVKTENDLKSNPQFFGRNFGMSNQKYPDLYVNIDGYKVAIEYERTRKSFSSYRQILTSYSIFREVDLVLFIVTTEAIKNTITCMAKRIQYPVERRPIAFAMATDVSKNLFSFPVAINENTVSFDKLIKDLREAKGIAA